MKRNLVLLTLLLLFGTSVASAQVVYQLTSVPTFVIDTGRSEVLGSVRLTATNATVIQSSTIQVLYQGVTCDNSYLSGSANVVNLTVVAAGTPVPPPGITNLTVAGATGLAAAGVVAIGTVTNTPAGCIVSFTTTNNGTTSAIGDILQLGGARGRIDLGFGVNLADGQPINAQLNATPSNSSLFTAPSSVVVATPEPGLQVKTLTVGSILNCGVKKNPAVRIIEGYNAAFVQHVTSVSGFAPPSVAGGLGRPFAGNQNTNILITITQTSPPPALAAGTGVAGVTLTWPVAVIPNAPAVAFTTADTAGSGSALVLVGSATTNTPRYEFICGDQRVCDVQQDIFDLNPVVIGGTPPSTGGSFAASWQATLGLLLTDTATVAGASPTAPDTTDVNRPRFKNNPLNNPGDTIYTAGPCRTVLLFPWVTNFNAVGCGAAGCHFDTGITLANTSLDTPALSSGNATPQNGTCTITLFPRSVPFSNTAVAATTNSAAGTTPPAAVQVTTNTVNAGDTWSGVMSNILGSAAGGGPFANVAGGYIITVCNFQFAHGFAFITDNFGLGNANTAQGYIALIIPDPVSGGTIGTSARLPQVPISVANAGEQLTE